MKAWQRGIELDRLKAASAIFTAHDRGLVFGAFGGVNEAKIAEWMDRSCWAMPAPGVALAAKILNKPAKVKDFRGVQTAVVPGGSMVVERVGYEEGLWPLAARALAEMRSVYPAVAVWLFQEHEGDRQIVESLGARLLAVKIRASSELLGLYGLGSMEPSPLSCRETLGLARLGLYEQDVSMLRRRLELIAPEWADHYSGYNERGTWSALALRGFSDDPRFIEKPTEMSRKWKAEHPAALAEPCRDTLLRFELPEAEPLIASIPGPKQRVRLMRLTGGGGLSRHADITDPESGASEGRLMRIHIPIKTNGGVRFRSWRPSGDIDEANMRQGEAWYLDTRKPHAAVNESQAERIHLVIDTFATPELLALLPC